MKRLLAWLYLTVAVVVLAFVLAVALFDWNALRDEIGAFASARLAREVRLVGNLDVDPGWTVRARARDVRIANAEWAPAQPFLQAEAVEVALNLGALLRGRTAMPEITIHQPRVRLARNAEGKVNWDFLLDGATGGDLPAVRQLEIAGGLVTYDDPGLDESIRVTFEHVTGSLTADERLRLYGTAQVGALPASVELEARPVAPGEGWRTDAVMQLAAVVLAVSGTLGEPDLRVELRAEDLSQFDVPPLASLPYTPPVRLETRLTRDGDHWLLDNLDVSIGERHLDGDIRIDFDQTPPMVWATLYLDSLPIPKRPAPSPDDPLIADVPIPTEPLKKLNLRANLRIGEIESDMLSARDLRVSARIENGRLTLAPLSLQTDEGRIAGRWVLDAGRQPPASTLHLQIEQPRLGGLLPLAAREAIEGRASGRIDLRGAGADLRSLLADAEGQIVFVMRDGALSTRLVELAGIVPGERPVAKAAEAERTLLRCAIAAFVVEGGVLRTRPVVFDTHDNLLTVEGYVDAVRDEIDLTMTAYPKDPGLLAMRAPIRVAGSLRDPDIAPEGAPLATRRAAALALGALAGPIGAVMPLVEPGLAEDQDCMELVGEQPPGEVRG